MASELSRVLSALSSMTREYYSNPSPALKNRIDKAIERKNRLEAKTKKKPNLKIRREKTT